jgi:hypothetical protein
MAKESIGIWPPAIFNGVPNKVHIGLGAPSISISLDKLIHPFRPSRTQSTFAICVSKANC